MTANPETIAQQVNRRAASSLVPLNATLELTYRCNHKCSFCYRCSSESSEMSLKEWQHVLNELAGAGTLYLTITGGEPFLHPDFMSIIEFARKSMFAVSIITNGSLLDYESAAHLKNCSIMDIGISILASTPERHDRITGIHGSFDRAVKALENARNAGLKTLVKHTVAQENFGEYLAVRDLAESKGALFECDTVVMPSHQGIPSVSALTVEQHAAFMHDMQVKISTGITDKCAQWRLHCDAGRSVCGITPSGDVLPCILLPLSFGNILENSFNSIWHSRHAEQFRSIEACDDARCVKCTMLDSCARCHAAAYLETGDLTGPSPTLCRRAEAAAGVAKAGEKDL